jgi:hypothetical protein
MVITLISACLFAVLVAVVSSKSLHLPGVSPSSYNDNDPVKVSHFIYQKLISHVTSLTHSLTHSPTHSLTHSLTYSLSYWFIHLLIHLLQYYSCINLLTYSLTHSLTHSLTYLLTYLFFKVVCDKINVHKDPNTLWLLCASLLQAFKSRFTIREYWWGVKWRSNWYIFTYLLIHILTYTWLIPIREFCISIKS